MESTTSCNHACSISVVIEVVEELPMVDHLFLTLEKPGGYLTEVHTGIEPLNHSVVVETLTNVLKEVHTVDTERNRGLEEDLKGLKVGLGHPLDRLVAGRLNLSAVVEHVTNVGHGQAEFVKSLDSLLVRSI